MIYYKVTHKYKLLNHIEKKEIGIYNSIEKANEAVNGLKDKNGFSETKEGFYVKKVLRFITPKLLNKTFWVDGFDTYFYVKNINKRICYDESLSILKHFGFLIKEYDFEFNKFELGNYLGENGKVFFYGPFNCYCFYNESICINFLNLVQRQDWYITITNELSNNQTYIMNGYHIETQYCYNWDLLATVMKNDIDQLREIFGHPIYKK